MIQYIPTDSKPKSIAIERIEFSNQYQSTSSHPESEITYVLNGSGTLFIGNVITPYQSGDLIFIGPNIPHVFMPDDKLTIISDASSVYFTPENIRMLLEMPEMAELKKFFSTYKFGFIIKKNESNLFPHFFDQIHGTSGADLLFKFFQLINILSINENIESFQPFANAKNIENLRLEKVFNYVRQNIGKNINLTTVASVANMTPNAFCRFFKQQCGCQFITYLNATRVSFACREIISRGHILSISETAYRVGFNSVTNFNRVFKIVMGVSPTEYLIQHRSKIG